MDFVMTEMQQLQYDRMREALKRISLYQSPDNLREICESEYGLDYESALEMSYENIQAEAVRVLDIIATTDA